MPIPTYTSFDDWKAWMQTIVMENGVGAITGPLLQEVLNELSDTSEWLVNTSGGSADGRALAAEGWAVGTQRGVPVTEGSPYYQNNSAYYAGVVQQVAEDLGDALREAQQAVIDCNAAAENATQKAGLANDAASLANEKAGVADAAAELAGEKAELAAEKAALADEKAQYAEQKGDYAQAQIDGAKGDYESLDARPCG